LLSLAAALWAASFIGFGAAKASLLLKPRGHRSA